MNTESSDVPLLGYYPGVVGRIIELHAVYYYENWGFDISFETQVGRELSEFMAINVSYTFTGILIGLPILVLLIRTHYRNLLYVLLTIGFFISAILFREMDSRDIHFLPMGTHFLWHAFTGFGAFFILAYLYNFRKSEI